MILRQKDARRWRISKPPYVAEHGYFDYEKETARAWGITGTVGNALMDKKGFADITTEHIAKALARKWNKGRKNGLRRKSR